MMVEIAISLVIAYVAFGVVAQRWLPFDQYPYYWAFYWATAIFNVIGVPFLESEGWLEERHLVALFVVLLQMIALAVLFRIGQRQPAAIHWKRQLDPRIDTRGALCCLWLLSLVIVAVWTLLNGPPLLFQMRSLIGINEYDLKAMRVDIQFGESKFHWFRHGFFTLPQVIATSHYLAYLYRPTKAHRIMAGIAFAYAIVMGSAFLNKNEPLLVVIFLFAARSIYSGRLVGGRFLLTAGLLVSLILGGYVLYDPELFSQQQWYAAILDRIFVAYARANAVCFNVWPNDIPFLDGTTLPMLGSVLGYDQVDAAKILHFYAYGQFGHGQAPCANFADGYINFGWTGFLIWSLLAQLTIWVIQSVVARNRLNYVSAALAIVLIKPIVETTMVPSYFAILETTMLVMAACVIAVNSIAVSPALPARAGRRVTHPARPTVHAARSYHHAKTTR